MNTSQNGDSAKQKLESGNSLTEIDDIIPITRDRISHTKAFALDLLLPGGGHFYIRNYYMGAIFGIIKVLGGYYIYYGYRDWKDKRSEYNNSRRVYEYSEFLKMNDYTYAASFEAEKNKRDYDRAAQRITFIVLANTSVYISSLLLTYYNIRKINEKSIPTFELHYGLGKFDALGDNSLFIRFNFRI
ncbi:MAG: hypothetical protein SVZ03_14895 [Spirochaetota bacterium]|nr:hypothetical protein [Spirochaetota bacterium]